jgi:hypothetical protein
VRTGAAAVACLSGFVEQAGRHCSLTRVDTGLTERLRASFFIESAVPQYAENLKSLRGLKFDWGRSDLNQDHVYANQALTHKLNEFGIPHEAEEYNGVWGNKTWGDDFRIYNEVLPFFHKHLVFAANIDSSLK